MRNTLAIAIVPVTADGTAEYCGYCRLLRELEFGAKLALEECWKELELERPEEHAAESGKNRTLHCLDVHYPECCDREGTYVVVPMRGRPEFENIVVRLTHPEAQANFTGYAGGSRAQKYDTLTRLHTGLTTLPEPGDSPARKPEPARLHRQRVRTIDGMMLRLQPAA